MTEICTNPAERLKAFIERAQADPNGAATTVLTRVLMVENDDLAVLLRRYSEVLELARGCAAYASALRDRDPRIPEVGVQAVRRITAALEGIRLDGPWGNCLGAMGNDPILGVSWLIPYYPPDFVSPDQLRDWRERMLEALAGVRAVLDSVASGQRDQVWLRIRRAVERIVDYLNTIEVEGLEAAERAWTHALALEAMLVRRGTPRGWKQDLVQRVKVVGEIARTVNALIQVGMALSGDATVKDEMPSLPAPVEIKLLGSGTSEGPA